MHAQAFANIFVVSKYCVLSYPVKYLEICLINSKKLNICVAKEGMGRVLDLTFNTFHVILDDIPQHRSTVVNLIKRLVRKDRIFSFQRKFNVILNLKRPTHKLQDSSLS